MPKRSRLETQNPWDAQMVNNSRVASAIKNAMMDTRVLDLYVGVNSQVVGSIAAWELLLQLRSVLQKPLAK